MAESRLAWDDSPVVRRLAALPVGRPPDPDAKYRQAAREQNAERLLRTFTQPMAHGNVRMPPLVDWRELRATEEAEATAKAAAAKDLEDGQKAAAESKAALAEHQAKLAKAREALRQAELRAAARERDERLDELARGRAARKGRNEPSQKDRTWAIREFNRSRKEGER